MADEDRARLLVVSSDDRLEGIVATLRSVGHTVDTVPDIGAAVDAAEATAYDGVMVLHAPATETATARRRSGNWTSSPACR